MRKSYRCRFNQYVSLGNQDSIVASILSQFQGYNCEPEVTIEDDHSFVVTVTLQGDVTSTLVRDKLAFNYFVESVKAADSIRRVRKMTLPTPISSWVEATVVNSDEMTGNREGHEDNIDIELPEGARPDMAKLIGGGGTVASSWTKTADPQGTLVVPPFSGTNESVDEDQLSDIHDVTAGSSFFQCPFCDDFHSKIAAEWTEENGALPGKRRPTTTRDMHPDYTPPLGEPNGRDWNDKSLWRRGPQIEGEPFRSLHPEEIPSRFQVPFVDRVDSEMGFEGDLTRDSQVVHNRLCPKCALPFEPNEQVGRYIDEDQGTLDRGDKMTNNVPFHSDCLQQMRNVCAHLRRLDDSHFEFGPAQELWQRVEKINANRPSRFTKFHSHFRTATEQDGGGLAGFGKGIGETNVEHSLDAPRETKAPSPSMLGVPLNSWFTETGMETVKPNKNAEAPLQLAASKSAIEPENPEHITSLDLPEATQGGVVPGTNVHGWFSAGRNNIYFGLAHEHPYDEETDISEYDL